MNNMAFDLNSIDILDRKPDYRIGQDVSSSEINKLRSNLEINSFKLTELYDNRQCNMAQRTHR